MKAHAGTIYLVGAGPGDPKLITVHGREVLESADAVVHDRLISPELLKLARVGARIVDVGKAPGRASRSQDEINDLLIALAREGLSVCRLKGGDPFVFGRGGEEVLAARAAGIPVVVVPGISSALAGPTAADVPVTHRGVESSFTVVTGHDARSAGDAGVDWQRIAGTPGSIVVLMGVGNLGAIAGKLIEGGRPPDEPVRVVERATLPGQRVLSGTLATIEPRAREAGLTAPAVIVVGPVVGVLNDSETS
ncbi:MAG: uroporphyrinogen-III C-methyltransferase [Chloroflexota bacterium]|nr:uroporphyrinogen-III C-methyltransferase [Chloroflexota bacterium]MDE2919201.1 uroporphyrinogen-III C-methyltransferase [Chloroflexota bacterium]